jgi:hypothetical protein
MAEHETVTKDKHADTDRKHRTTQQDSQPSFDAFHAWAQGLIPLSDTHFPTQKEERSSLLSRSALTETPFYPRMEEHAEILSRIPYSAQRHEFIIHLNNTYGLRYAQRLVESVNAQAKLTVNAPNDIYEQEADRVAEAVTKSINNPVQRQDEEEELQMQEEEEEPVQMKISQLQLQEEKELQMQPIEHEEEPVQMQPVLQRQTEEEEEEEEEVQAQSAEAKPPAVSGELEKRINNAKGGGQPLAENIRKPMEQAFGIDFGGVRVYADSEADTLSRDLGAKAFTSGQDIFFHDGDYSTNSDSGRKLISHELMHVVQQKGIKDVALSKKVASKTKIKSKDNKRILIQRDIEPGAANFVLKKYRYALEKNPENQEELMEQAKGTLKEMDDLIIGQQQLIGMWGQKVTSPKRQLIRPPDWLPLADFINALEKIPPKSQEKHKQWMEQSKRIIWYEVKPGDVLLKKITHGSTTPTQAQNKLIEPPFGSAFTGHAAIVSSNGTSVVEMSQEAQRESGKGIRVRDVHGLTSEEYYYLVYRCSDTQAAKTAAAIAEKASSKQIQYSVVKCVKAGLMSGDLKSAAEVRKAYSEQDIFPDAMMCSQLVSLCYNLAPGKIAKDIDPEKTTPMALEDYISQHGSFRFMGVLHWTYLGRLFE